MPVAALTERARARRATLALLLVTLAWGLTFVWMKQALIAAERELGPSGATAGVGLFMTLRFALAALLLPLALPRSRRSLGARTWAGGLVLGGLLLGGFLLQMFGLRGVSAPVSAFLTSLYVVFTALLAAALRRRRPGASLALGAGLATLGAGFIGGPPQLVFDLPEWLTVGCALVFALHILATDAVTRRCDPLGVTLTSFVWVALGSAATLTVGLSLRDAPAALEVARLSLVPDFATPVLLSSVFATVLALSLMNLFQRDLEPLRAAVLYAVEPVWAGLAAVAVGLSGVDRWLTIGGAALLAGNLIAELGPLAAGRGTPRSGASGGPGATEAPLPR